MPIKSLYAVVPNTAPAAPNYLKQKGKLGNSAVVVSGVGVDDQQAGGITPKVRSAELYEAQIPSLPSAPPDLRQKTPKEFPHCERYFVYQGKKIECDSNTERDAEHLRPIMQDVPAALHELDLYQTNRKRIQITAYLGSAGLFAMILGILISRPAFDPVSGSPRFGGYIMLGGLGLSAHSFIYGMSMIKANESHIGNAVNLYNAARPDQPIGLQFNTSIEF